MRGLVRGLSVAVGVAFAVLGGHAQPVPPEREQMYQRYLQFTSLVKGGTVQARWLADGTSFWYAEGAPDRTIIYKVDPRAHTRQPLFDTPRLRRALAAALGHEPPYQGLPFAEFTFEEGERAARFTVENREFILRLDTYDVRPAPVLSEAERDRITPRLASRRPREAASSYYHEVREILSPDRQWFASWRDFNLWVRSTADGRALPLTTDGVEGYEWELDGARWSPDSSKLAAARVDRRAQYRVPVVHWLKFAEEVEWVPVTKAGGPLAQSELYVLDILSKRAVRLDTGDQPDHFFYLIGWHPTGSELYFFRLSRTYKRLELRAANPATGASRVLLTEAQPTFILGMEFLPLRDKLFTLLPDGRRFLWLSERDGFKHLYLYQLDGTLVGRVTQGRFPIVEPLGVDAEAGWVYFTAHGDPRRPYDTHLYRARLDGTAQARLTEASGQHSIQLAPSRQFFLDTHSSLTRPPVTELRAADGRRLQVLAEANVEALAELRRIEPEEFVVKAADGQTDLYGLLFKPYDFDPQKKYPVIECIYAGPQISVSPQPFTLAGPYGFLVQVAQALAQLGFITFSVDARGTTERGKAFQDHVFRQLGRVEIPDHVAALKQLAAVRPYLDTSRVGIFGASYGGYFTIRALLLAPEVYHVGVATAPVVDLYELAVAIEPYMELPAENKEGYEFAASPRLADRLQGKLLLIHGTSDINATFDSTMKMADALMRAGKPYDLIVLPGEPHAISGTARAYWLESLRRYFLSHLKP